MKVLVLGGSGYIGSRLCAMLADSTWVSAVSGSRRATASASTVRVDSTDAASMKRALRGMDAVVNCVAGSAPAIAQGAHVLVQAANEVGCQRIVHLSTMSVYGAFEGEAHEDTPRDPSIGWYAKAKCDAEDAIAAFATHGGSVVMLRPGCVWGPGSELWVGRIGRLLHARRLGDLGAAGDGWSNLVSVDDVCAAIVASLGMEARGAPLVYNLAAPDSPRWNDYFVDLALAIGATPVRRLSPRQLQFDARLASPALKLAQIALTKARRGSRHLPDPLPPGLLGVFERQLHLRGDRARQALGWRCTPYTEVLRSAATWFMSNDPVRTGAAQRTLQVPPT